MDRRWRGEADLTSLLLSPLFASNRCVGMLALAGTGRLTERNGQAWLDGHPLLNPLRLDSSGQLSPDRQQR